jgi:O-antigen/teichoic acid export membrane protein
LSLAVLSSFFSQAYVSLVGILLLPAYLRYLGAEGVGLIGLFVMLQALLPLLDLGLSAVLSRDMSRMCAGQMDPGDAWLKLRSLIRLVSLMGAVVVAVVVALRGPLASGWLQPGEITRTEVEYCLVTIALAAVLRWVAGVYRSALVGLEEQTWLNASAMAMATIKHVGVLPVLAWYSSTASAYFSYQTGAGLLELLALRYAVSRRFSAPAVRPDFSWSETLRESRSLAGSMLFLSIVWILFNQTDRLVLSRVLTLSDFGYFSIAASLAGGILVLIPPLAQVVQPRMTILASQGRTEDLMTLYLSATQGATALFSAAGGTIAMMSPMILHAWIGDPKATDALAPMLFWYGCAGTLVGILALPFMLQFAFGDLKMHVQGNILLCLFGLPLLVVASALFGAVGAGAALCISRLSFLLFWIPRAHRKYLSDSSSRWLVRDVLPGLTAAMAILASAAMIVPVPQSRVTAGVAVVIFAVLALAAGGLAGGRSRQAVFAWIGRGR